MNNPLGLLGYGVGDDDDIDDVDSDMSAGEVSKEGSQHEGDATVTQQGHEAEKGPGPSTTDQSTHEKLGRAHLACVGRWLHVPLVSAVLLD
jgi:hypothetical protein